MWGQPPSAVLRAKLDACPADTSQPHVITLLMPSTRQGSIRLFRFAGVDVFLHWSWFLVATYEISNRAGTYSSITWNILEYLALFLIVMLHEFGHALACRQVGGRANQIVLWPLGGVAYVDPPPRPGPTLWSIPAATASPAPPAKPRPQSEITGPATNAANPSTPSKPKPPAPTAEPATP